MKKHHIILLLTVFTLLASVSVAEAQAVDNSAPASDNSITASTDSSVSTSNVKNFPFQQTFTITAYYSPVEGQKRYIRGSLQADKKLNGNGTNGADGTQVYPGMIAAPKNIPFGTKMKIPGIGTVAVHDRGGAIVSAGQRGQYNDRLDVWMGSGDQGLSRALQWGKRSVTVMVYGVDDSVVENINLSAFDANFQSYLAKAEGNSPRNSSSPQIFHQDFGLGDQDPEIIIIKQKLNQLKYFNGDFDDQFDAKTYQAVINFQQSSGIIDSEQDFGAGYFGPQTRKTLEKAATGLPSNANHQGTLISVAKASPVDQTSENIKLAGNGLSFTTTDLQPGDSGQSVLELQTELKKLNLFGIEPTGYYGEVTTHAIFKFQQSQGLIGDELSIGAGTYGPATRGAMLAIVNSRIATRRIIADRENQFLANK